MSRIVKIGFVSSNLAYPWGGAEKPWTHVAEAALQAQHQVLAVVTPQVAEHPRIQALVASGARLHVRTRFSTRVSWLQRLRVRFDPPARWESLRSALTRFRPDVLVLNQGGVFDFLIEDRLVDWCRAHRVSFVLYCHCNSEAWHLTPVERGRARDLFSAARATLFVSTHNRQVAEHQLAADISRAFVLPSPIAETFADQPPAWPSLPTPAFAVIARLDAHHKGLDLLVPALAHALPRHTAWKVNFYGEGPDRAYLEALAQRHAIADRLYFHGFATDVRAIWAENQMLLMPSRHEGCSLSMLEALACGRPVLATQVGGVSDWVRDGINGFVCPAPTVSLVGAALAQAWRARASWAEMGSAAARLFREARSPNPTQALLRAILGEFPATSPPSPAAAYQCPVIPPTSVP